MHFLFLFPVTWGDLSPFAEAPTPATWGCHAQITPMRLSERLPSAEVEMDGSTDANPKLKRKNTEEASKPEGKGAGQDEMSLRNFRGVILAANLSGATCTWELQLFRLPSGQR